MIDPDAKKILEHLHNDGYSFTIMNDANFICYKNDDFKPDDGSNPFLVCDFDELTEAIKQSQIVSDWSTQEKE